MAEVSMPSQAVDRHLVPVLAGGGARLPAHIGILAALETLGVTYSDLVGVSGGSIVAALRAANYDLPQIRQISEDTDFSQFLGQNLISLLRTGGLSNGDRFQRWMDEKMEGRCFADLDRKLHVVATDVRSGQAVVFNARHSPDMPVSLAVRYSMSVPLLFSFKNHGERVMTDGSILSEEALRRDWKGDGTPVVVFKLRGHKGLEQEDGKPLVPLGHYLSMLIHTFMTTLSHEHVNEAFWLSTIIIDIGDVSPVAFSLQADIKDQLYTAGYENTLSYLPLKLRRAAQQAAAPPDEGVSTS